MTLALRAAVALRLNLNWLSPADLAMKLCAFDGGEVVHICDHSQPLCAEIEALVGMPQQQRGL